MPRRRIYQTNAEKQAAYRKRKKSARVTVHFQSILDVRATPADLFAVLDREFSFELDVCALPHNAKCRRYFTPATDGLSQEWQGACFMNPPYGRNIGDWLKKAYESAQAGATVVCLIPSRTDAAWWHDYVMRAEVRFLRGRLCFGGSQSSAPFPSAVVVFRPNASGQGMCHSWTHTEISLLSATETP
jgi:phage N-6-adenine-methyltransferase